MSVRRPTAVPGTSDSAPLTFGDLAFDPETLDRSREACESVAGRKKPRRDRVECPAVTRTPALVLPATLVPAERSARLVRPMKTWRMPV
ncbi:hypothetical protein [Streptomyces sp. S.PNR 29]|uniref:hypothetical protein n=1 Tax=Streptomyces sp. S.PNR 29 TaxID=2973805 RepID=UPI0025AFEB70|nr:hypothetical protein [Streptomyces sp. S.PNR 29]MDN0200379.1 hypothetical protein [Streptomyces sp. S.PNR 29]